MPVMYRAEAGDGGKQLIPAPFVNIQKEFQTTEDGTIIGQVFVLTIRGKCMAWKGSPSWNGNSSNVATFYTGPYQPGGNSPPADQLTVAGNSDKRLESLFRKQEALRNLFSEEGHTLQFTPWENGPSLKCNPRIRRISLPDELWYEYFDYEIVCEADVIYGLSNVDDNFGGPNHDQLIVRFANEWNLEPQDEIGRVYKLIHNVSAVGKRFYKEDGGGGSTLVCEAWEAARNYVLRNIKDTGGQGVNFWVQDIRYSGPGPDRGKDYISPANLDLQNASGPNGGFGFFNELRTEHINKSAGVFAVSQSWILAQGNVIEDIVVNGTTDETGRTTARVEGSLRALSKRKNANDANDWQQIWDNSGDPLQRLNDADSYFNSKVIANINFLNGYAMDFSRTPVYDTASKFITGGPNGLHPVPLTRSVVRNKFLGTINYAYTFDDRITIGFGSISELYTINLVDKADLFANIPVLGRVIGPILQPLGTVTAKRYILNIQIQVPCARTLQINKGDKDQLATLNTFARANTPNPAPDYPLDAYILNNLSPLATIKNLLSLFLERDETSWLPLKGSYNRTIQWTFEDPATQKDRI